MTDAAGVSGSAGVLTRSPTTPGTRDGNTLTPAWVRPAAYGQRPACRCPASVYSATR